MRRDLFDLPESIRRRDAGMKMTLDWNARFADQYREYILRLPSGWKGTNEDVRRNWTGILPEKPNAWGSCWGAAVRAGLLIMTPEIVRMESVRSHARKTHIYRRS